MAIDSSKDIEWNKQMEKIYQEEQEKGNYYRVSQMNGYDLYDILCEELKFNDMIILYKLIKHKMETLEDETRNYCNCEKVGDEE